MSTPQQPKRVTVTAPTNRRRGRPLALRTPTGRAEVDVDRLRALMRAQLRLGLTIAAIVAGGLALIPLLFALAPALGTVRVFGVGLPWVLLAGPVYPLLVVFAWWYVRTAERTEEGVHSTEKTDRATPASQP